ncbi:ABC transporter ATP-binding protein [Curtobacterium sp. USHLN213]|uniref:ABC transporter ATP-binding protein n=1 Tax=Curtobacterium sp. USHLN213 TaxID=3081255 RepID=UPI00301654F3
MAILTVSDVSKSFNGTTVLHPIDLTVEDGSFCCMLGSSGSGKSTLLRIIAGLEEPDAGTVRIGDRDVTHQAVERRRIGFVFQNYALFPHLDVLANVMYGLRARGVSRAEARKKAQERIALVGLSGFEHRKPAQLSGGQQQRVALARALVVDPEVLLLDEPLSALDRKIRGEMQRELARVHAETGLTTVMVTHDQEEAMGLADTVLMLDGGRVQQYGTPKEMYARPSSQFVASFLGAEPVGTGAVVGELIDIGGTRFAVPGHGLEQGSVASVVVKSESVILHPAGDLRGTNSFTGAVESIDFTGPFARAVVRVGGVWLPSTMAAHQADGIEAGQSVGVTVVDGGLHAYSSEARTVA